VTERNAGVLEAYPELDIARMTVQLAMFKSQFSYQTLHEAKASLQGMVPEVKNMFTQVELLVRLMLLCPVSSCDVKRSFSCLRRLKTWLRSSMTQSASQLCHCLSRPPGSAGQPPNFSHCSRVCGTIGHSTFSLWQWPIFSRSYCYTI